MPADGVPAALVNDQVVAAAEQHTVAYDGQPAKDPVHR
jgi:hypothetical protein